MTLDTKPLAEVTSRGFEVLIQELGPSDAIRFINQFGAGFGDYTAERDALFGDLTLDQILARVGPPVDDEA